MYLKNIIKKFIPWVDMSSKIYKWYLKSHGNELKGNKLLAGYYSYKIYKKYNCVISAKAQIGKNLLLPHPMGVIIGDRS